MALRILFADDSVTAQNMGKKILTEAGYHVVAVSNGAAAVKKIAEQKPDIIILDVHMPGYSGLEVCEKVRGSVETFKTPVLLSVGKMEPYKPEEANRVRADGVIVKPFEASDLLAMVKKFEERIGQASAPTLAQPIPAERFHEPATPPLTQAHELSLEQPEPPVLGSTLQATVEVPDHMAITPAFSDLLNMDTAHAMDNFHTPASSIAVPSSTIEAPLPDYDIPVSWRIEALPEPAVITAPVPQPAPRPTPAPAAFTLALPLANRPQPIPVYQEPNERSPLELVPTAAPPTGEIDIPREPEPKETTAETTRNTIAEGVGPGLIRTLHQEEEPLEHPLAREAGELAPLGAEAILSRLQEVAPVNSPGPELEAHKRRDVEPVSDPEPVERKIAESDFEARVAAAMAAYNFGAAIHEDANDSTYVPGASLPVIEEQPMDKPSSSESLAALAVAGTGTDRATIAQAVHRVMERLKPKLVEEIVRELKANK